MFLSIWHDQAQDLMSSWSYLRAVCWELADSEWQLGPDKLGVQLF